MTSQGARSLEALVDQQTVEMGDEESWEGACERKHGPGAPFPPRYGFLVSVVLLVSWYCHHTARLSDLKGAISVLVHVLS